MIPPIRFRMNTYLTYGCIHAFSSGPPAQRLIRASAKVVARHMSSCSPPAAGKPQLAPSGRCCMTLNRSGQRPKFKQTSKISFTRLRGPRTLPSPCGGSGGPRKGGESQRTTYTHSQHTNSTNAQKSGGLFKQKTSKRHSGCVENENPHTICNNYPKQHDGPGRWMEAV